MSELNKDYVKSIARDIEESRWNKAGDKYGPTPFGLHRAYDTTLQGKDIVRIPITLCDVTVGDIELTAKDALRLAHNLIAEANSII